MSALSELHHDTALLIEPERRFTGNEWTALRDRCTKAAWATTNMFLDFDTAWRLTDAVLRAAMPDRVPEGDR